MKWLREGFKKLFGLDYWMVPEAIVCPHCGGSMVRGRMRLRDASLFFWTSQLRSTFAIWEGMNRKPVKLFRGTRASLAYRCEGCASVFITTPQTVGTPAGDAD